MSTTKRESDLVQDDEGASRRAAEVQIDLLLESCEVLDRQIEQRFEQHEQEQ